MTSKINLTWSWSFIITYILYIRNCIVVVQSLSCLTLCSLRHSNTPAFSVLHYLPKFAQTHIHWANDAVQLSHLLSPPSPALSLPQGSGSFQWVGSLHQSIKASASVSVLLMIIQDWFPLGLTGLISLQSKGLSRVFSSTTVQMHQFFSA